MSEERLDHRAGVIDAARLAVAAEVGSDEPKIILIYTAGRCCIRVDVPPSPQSGLYRSPDGPGPDNLFWWRGRSVRLRPREWKLVAYLWAERAATLAEVRDACWGEPVTDGTIRVSMHVANSAFLKIGCAVQLTQDDGYVKVA